MNKHLKVLKNTYKNYKYFLISLLSGYGLLFVIAWVGNLSLLNVIVTSNLGFFAKIKFITFFIANISANSTLFGFVLTILTAILFGINMALIIRYIRLRPRIQGGNKFLGLPIGGVILGLFGAGCAACGSLLLAPVIGSFGVVVLNFLPFKGIEISIFGVAILFWSYVKIVSKLDNPYI